MGRRERKRARKPEEASESVEEYLETMCRLEEEEESLSNASISAGLRVSPSSVSGMLRKLLREGYVKHEPYGGISLTEKGRSRGKKVLGKHRLIERFLEGMGIRKNAIHDEACRLEHYVSDELEGAMRKRLEPPPRAKGVLSLAALRKGDEGEIIGIETGRSAARRLEDMGLTPGTSVKVVRSAPFSGPVEIRVRDSSLVIGGGMASRIFLKVKP